MPGKIKLNAPMITKKGLKGQTNENFTESRQPAGKIAIIDKERMIVLT